ncbi:hypothetical protein TB1_036261 [Malus domestica]
MARIFGAEQIEANTNLEVGTYGYMSPEYAMKGLFSVKSDESRALEIIDSSLGEPYPVNEVLRCVHIALLCVQEHAKDHPLMFVVVSMLGNDAAIPSPKQPGFLLKRSYHTSGDPSDNTEGAYSINDMTHTEVEGR